MELMNKLSTNYVFDDNSYKNYKIEKGTGLSRNKISTQLSKKAKNEDKKHKPLLIHQTKKSEFILETKSRFDSERDISIFEKPSR